MSYRNGTVNFKKNTIAAKINFNVNLYDKYIINKYQFIGVYLSMKKRNLFLVHCVIAVQFFLHLRYRVICNHIINTL